MAFPADWSRSCLLNIPAANVGSGGVVNFTIDLKRSYFPDEMFSPTGGNAAQADGGDVRFALDAAGMVPLAPPQFDAFALDSSDGAGDADVRGQLLVPVLSSTIDNEIYVFYHAATTQTQPDGSAWDNDHCHRWALDENPAGSAPQFLDSVGDRHASAVGSVSSVAGQSGNAVNGGGSGCVVAPFSGFVSPNNTTGAPCTNTGLAYIDRDDRLAIANFDNAEIVITEKDGTEVSRFSVAAQITGIQGVAWNEDDGELAVVGASGSAFYRYSLTGSYLGSVTTTASSNAIAYDRTLGCYWMRTGTGGKNVQKVHKTTGANLGTVTVAAGLAIEGLTHNLDDDTLLFSTDAGQLVVEFNKITGATIRTFRAPHDTEHIAYDTLDQSLFANGDAGYHSSAQGGKNVVYRLTPLGQPWAWRAPTGAYSLEFKWKPTTVSTTGTALAAFSAVKLGGFFIEVQVRAGGVLRVYESDLSYAPSAAGAITAGVWQHIWVIYDPIAGTLTAYRDNIQIAQSTAAVVDWGPDGLIGIGARPNGATAHNGAIDDVRLHRSARSAAWRSTRQADLTNPAFMVPGTPTGVSEGEEEEEDSLVYCNCCGQVIP